MDTFLPDAVAELCEDEKALNEAISHRAQSLLRDLKTMAPHHTGTPEISNAQFTRLLGRAWYIYLSIRVRFMPFQLHTSPDLHQ